MNTWIPAIDVAVGTFVVERDGSTLEVTSVKPGRRTIELTARSLIQSGLHIEIPTKSSVRTIVPD